MQKQLITFFNEISEFYNSDIPFVVYRKPNEKFITAFIQKNKELHYLESFEAKGFVFSPFSKDEKKIIFPAEACTLLTSEITNEKQLEFRESNLKLRQHPSIKSKEKHLHLVEKAISFIHNNQAKKIVLSRKETINYTDVDLFNVLKKMLNNYTNALVYLWYHPKVGLWMGATPERLIQVNKKKFKTMALAGTQRFNSTIDVVWGEKEKQEQQFVTDYILESIHEKVDSIKASEAYTVKAGNLLHIRTDISGNLTSVQVLEDLVNSLHPTPAVCGIPKNEATKFIVENEGYNRVFYCGYLGELNMNYTTNLFVNLRCMQLNEKTVSIYVGGGITKDSNPENEWEETISKAEIMRKVL